MRGPIKRPLPPPSLLPILECPAFLQETTTQQQSQSMKMKVSKQTTCHMQYTCIVQYVAIASVEPHVVKGLCGEHRYSDIWLCKEELEVVAC